MINKLMQLFSKQKKYSNSNINIEILEEYNNTRKKSATKNICNAPFNSLYFGLGGNVSSCCHSRSKVLGNIKTHTIKEILQGKALQDFQKEMKNYNLSYSCIICKKQLLSGNYETVYAKKYDENRINRNNYPSFIEFELDNTCNLECEMCNGTFSSSIRKNREKLPPLISPYGKEFLKQIEEILPYVERANFLGGEPFLIDIYLEIWEKIIEINPKIQIYVQTNCTILNKRVKNILSKLNFGIGLSIDSFEKENYEKIRRNATFEKTYKNFEWFKQYCKEKNTFFGISVCAMPQNWKELLPIIEYGNKEDIPIFFNTVLQPKKMSFYSQDKDFLLKIIAKYSEVNLSKNTEVEKKNKLQFNSFINSIKNILKEQTKKDINFDTLHKELIKILKNKKNSKTRIENINIKFEELKTKLDVLKVEKTLSFDYYNETEFYQKILDKIEQADIETILKEINKKAK